MTTYPTTIIRPEVKAEIVRLLRADTRLGPERASYGMPPEGIPTEGIWLGESRGPVMVKGLRASRKAREDNWTIDYRVWAGLEGQTAEVAEARARDLWAPLDDTLADDPKLAGAVSGLLSAVLDDEVSIDSAPEGDGEGYVAWIEGQIRCFAHLL